MTSATQLSATVIWLPPFGVAEATAAATRCGAGTRCPIDTTRVSLTGIEVGQGVVAVLAVLVISGEYSTGMIRTTFTAMPRRWTVLGAKAAGADRPGPHGPTVRAAAGSVLYLALVGLLALGIATIVRDPAAATGTVLKTTGLRDLVISPWGARPRSRAGVT